MIKEKKLVVKISINMGKAVPSLIFKMMKTTQPLQPN